MTRSFPIFIPPYLPRLVQVPPRGPGWLHEPKLDGWRIQISKHRDDVVIYTRRGHDCAARLPRVAAALRALPVNSCSIDGELVGDDEDRIGNLWSLHRALGAGREDLVSVMAFDLLREGNEDLRALALSERKMRLEALLEQAKIPGLSYVAAHPDGGALWSLMEELGLEGVVSKRAAAPYRSGRRLEWVKSKCPSWLAANRDRWKMFR